VSVITAQAIREFAAKLTYFHSPDELDLVLNTVASTIERQQKAVAIALEVLWKLSWEGSSVNFPARTAINQLRDLGFERGTP